MTPLQIVANLKVRLVIKLCFPKSNKINREREMGLFGFGKKPEAPKPKTLLEMNDEELKAAKKEIADNMKVSKRENERQIF